MGDVTYTVGTLPAPAGQGPVGSVEIKSYDNFQKGVDTLGGLHTQIVAKLKEGEKFIEALTAAASKGTVAPAGGGTTVTETPGSRVVPHVYQETVAAAKAAVIAANKVANPCATSLKTTIDDLQSTLTTQRAIQDKGTDAAKKA